MAERTLTPVTDGPGAPDHDPQAEQALLGTVLRHPHNLHHIHPGDLYDPRHVLIHAALARLTQASIDITTTTLMHELRTTGDLDRAGGGLYLIDLDTQAVGDTTYWAKIVAAHAHRRRLRQVATRMLQGLNQTTDPDQVNATAWDTLSALLDPTTPTSDREPPPDLDTFLNTHEPAHDWLIPGFLERQDRLILTAGEGHGKSMLLRQWAVQCAAGIHPFTYEPMPPLRVLHLDLENSTRQNRREYRPLRIKAGTNLDHSQLYLEHRIDGIDLTQSDDRTWVEQLVAQVKPDLLITGPIYKMANGDPTEEKSAKPVAMFLDHLRATHGIAVLLEAHASKAVGGARKRAHEPYGWSGWLRWPEFGLWLDQDGALAPWRGSRDASRSIPVALTRGGEWPWTVVHDKDEIDWQRIATAIRLAGKKLTVREIETATGISRSATQRLLTKRAVALIYLLSELGLEDPDDDDD